MKGTLKYLAQLEKAEQGPIGISWSTDNLDIMAGMVKVHLLMSLQTHLIFKYYNDVVDAMDVMEYLVLLDQLVHLGKMVPMVKME